MRLPWVFGCGRVLQPVDPAFAASMSAFFRQLTGSKPCPVPEGQGTEEYFNAHYEHSGPGPAYLRFQARMIAAASNEMPAPDFKSVEAGVK